MASGLRRGLQLRRLTVKLNIVKWIKSIFTINSLKNFTHPLRFDRTFVGMKSYKTELSFANWLMNHKVTQKRRNLHHKYSNLHHFQWKFDLDHCWSCLTFCGSLVTWKLEPQLVFKNCWHYLEKETSSSWHLVKLCC